MTYLCRNKTISKKQDCRISLKKTFEIYNQYIAKILRNVKLKGVYTTSESNCAMLRYN